MNCPRCHKPIRESDRGFFINGEPAHFECLLTGLGQLWDMPHLIGDPDPATLPSEDRGVKK